MNNTEVRDAFASVYAALVSGSITHKDAAQRNVALNGILASARLELEALKTLKQPGTEFWIEGQGPITNEQLGAKVRHIAKEG